MITLGRRGNGVCKQQHVICRGDKTRVDHKDFIQYINPTLAPHGICNILV